MDASLTDMAEIVVHLVKDFMSSLRQSVLLTINAPSIVVSQQRMLLELGLRSVSLKNIVTCS